MAGVLTTRDSLMSRNAHNDDFGVSALMSRNAHNDDFGEISPNCQVT